MRLLSWSLVLLALLLFSSRETVSAPSSAAGAESKVVASGGGIIKEGSDVVLTYKVRREREKEREMAWHLW